MAATTPTTGPTATVAARRTGSPGSSDCQNYSSRRMDMKRLVMFALGAALSVAAHAQQFPTKRVAFVSGVTPGSASDTMARIIAEKLQQKWNQTVIVENRLGAGGLVGAKYVAGSEPDGHLIMMYASAFTVSPLLQPDVMKTSELQPVAMVATIPTVLVAQPEKYKTIKDFVGAAKANPGKLVCADAGIGSADCYFALVFQAKKIVDSGKLVALATSSPKRSALMPDVPTLEEQGFQNASYNFWVGALVPARTPRAIVDQLNRDITAVVESPEVTEHIKKLGCDPLTGTVKDFEDMVAKELRENGELIKKANIKPN